MSEGQADGFESSLQSFFTWCAGTSACPWRTGADPTGTLQALIASSAASPVPAGGGRTAGAGELYDALLDGLYCPIGLARVRRCARRRRGRQRRARWSPCRTTTTRTARPTATTRRWRSTVSTTRSRRTSAAYAILAAVFKASAPVFGPLLAWGEAACAVWPAPPTRTGRAGQRRRAHRRSSSWARPVTRRRRTLGRQRVARAQPRRAAHVRRRRPRGVLLQRCVRGYVQTYLVSGATPRAVCAGPDRARPQ